MVNFGEFLKKPAVKQYYQTGHLLMEYAKIEKFKCDILSNFQAMQFVPDFICVLRSFEAKIVKCAIRVETCKCQVT